MAKGGVQDIQKLPDHMPREAGGTSSKDGSYSPSRSRLDTDPPQGRRLYSGATKEEAKVTRCR